MRLPLIRPAELSPRQRALYDAFEGMVEDVMLHFPDLAQPLGLFVDLAQRLPGLSERARQVVILTIGGRFNVAYEMYAHARLASRAGLRPDQVATLCTGGRPCDLTEEDVLASDVATALIAGGPVPGPLYDTLVETLGQEAFDAIVFITIHYLALGTLLNAYDVPAGSPSSGK